jgi:hypothetical protein
MRYRQLVYIILVLIVAAIPFVIAACAPAPTPTPVPLAATVVSPDTDTTIFDNSIVQREIKTEFGLVLVIEDNSRRTTCYLYQDDIECTKY